MKKKYIAPLTEKTEVEMENGFMKASVVDKEDNRDNPVESGNQEIGGNYDFTTGDDPWK